ncbi:MAG: AsmA family protein [Phycisphaerales bacterium]|nr:AsmA family protein [Phycisphaerales bacterium]
MTDNTDAPAPAPEPKKKGGLLKILIAIPVALVVLLIAAVIVAAMYVDSIAKAGVEQGGSYALGVKTSLRSADVKLLSGGVSLNGLNVANPSGFTTPHFLSLDDGSVDVSLSSLRSETVEVSTFELSGIDINLEKSAQGANYKAILDNLKKLEGKGGSKDPAPTKESGKQFVIKQLTLRDISVHADVLPIGGKATRVNAKIDKIEMKDVGSKGGVDMGQLASIITKAILQSIANAGINLPADVLGDLQGQLSQLQSLADAGVASVMSDVDGQVQQIAGQAQQIADEVGKQVEGVGKEIDKVGKEAEKALKGLGDLLGGDNKPK